MEYKLAKQLKEAGFPQKKYLGGLHVMENGICPKIRTASSVYMPVLSDLIMACGDYFQLTKWNDNNDDEKWIASEEIYYDDSGYQNDTGKGKTPEEAVARLYIKLNEK